MAFEQRANYILDCHLPVEAGPDGHRGIGIRIIEHKLV